MVSVPDPRVCSYKMMIITYDIWYCFITDYVLFVASPATSEEKVKCHCFYHYFHHYCPYL